MELNSQTVLPNDLDEAIEILKTFYKNSIEEIKRMEEEEFMASSHFGAGMFIRNEWYLWWHEGHNYQNHWPAHKPKLNEMFNNHGITHADDMSGIILTSLYRSIHGLDIQLDKQIKHYQDYWKNNGYPDGIPK